MTIKEETIPPVLSAMQRVLQKICPQEYPVVAPFISQLYYAEQAGHTYIDINSKTQKILADAPTIIGKDIEETPLILWHNKLFFARLFRQEQYLGKWLNQHNTPLFSLNEHTIKHAQDQLTRFAQQGLHENQLQAVALSLLKPFLLICGGPGTGKTTTVARILILLSSVSEHKPFLRIALAAPTGKAAARMTEALHATLAHSDNHSLRHIAGQTLHRLLGINPVTGQPRYHLKEPLPYDVIIVDEASMLDLPLLMHLFAAVKEDARLILLGDPDQLPAIGAGAFVRQLANSDQLSETSGNILSQLLPQARPQLSLGEVVQDGFAVTLSFSHRFGQDSAIGQLADAVRQQQANRACQLMQEQYALQLTPDRTAIYAQFYRQSQAYWTAIAQNNILLAFQAFKQLIVLAPLKYQSAEFNARYIRYLHGKQHRGETWFAGLPILITENDYQQDLFNGDIGLVLSNEQGQSAVYFEIANGLREIALGRLPNFEPAFAITVHKSQGSEYEAVWLLAPEQEQALFSRSLFYTALTRAKKSFAFWGDESQVRYALNNSARRKSALNEMIAQYQKKENK